MNGLTATGITVGICAGLWQMVSSQVGRAAGWELLGTIGFVAFCSFYAAGGGNAGFVKSLANIRFACGAESISLFEIFSELTAYVVTGSLHVTAQVALESIDETHVKRGWKDSCGIPVNFRF